MADIATAEAPVTTPTDSAPVVTPGAPPSPQVETTTAGGQATTAEAAPASLTPPEEAVPDLTELLKKHPKVRDQFEGMTGERMRQAAARALQDADQKRQQEDAQRFAWNEQQAIQQENQLRYQEDQRLRQLQQMGDPFDITAHINATKARQDQWDAQWKATQTQRQAYAQIQQQIVQAAEHERLAIKAELDAHFRELPIEVQREVQQKDYASRAEALRDWRLAEKRFDASQHEATHATRREADRKKLLAELNLSTEDFDFGGGTPVSGGSYRYLEEAEAAYRANKITTAEYRQYRQALPYRRGR